ncbi:MAG: alpha/beta fold hydrolase [Acidimicrobiales bacterium]
MSEYWWTDSHGVEVFGRRWLPAGDPVASVVVVHGASEHSRRYERMADVLAKHGYAVYALDLRGQGRTASSTGAGLLGPGGFEGLVGDVEELVAQARGENPAVPLVLFSHSLGSMIGLVVATSGRTPLDGLVLSGSLGASPDGAVIAEMLQSLVDAGEGDSPVDLFGSYNAGFEPARTKFDWLSRDEAEVDAYIADPLCGEDLPLPPRYLVDLVPAAMAASSTEGLARLRPGLPVLFLTGEEDPVSLGAAHVRTLEAALRDAGASVTAHYYPGARHEVLNEINRDEVQADLVDWLQAVTNS